jgi:5'-deoxy-5'-methylthioadenosine phosphorylase
MSGIAIIGGTGLTALQGLEIVRREVVHTPFGEPSGPLTHGRLREVDLVFLPRHGAVHNIPPHRINYRANLWALQHIGVRRIIAVSAVGGIAPSMPPGRLAFPRQIVDYTYARDHTFFEDGLSHVVHVDFTEPYCGELRDLLVAGAQAADLDAWDGGTYGATQGPRLETAAEIDRMERDGCDMVGMTGMPEAALARELELCYACCAVSANWAAGRSEGPITMEAIRRNLGEGMDGVVRLLDRVLPLL